MLNLSEKDKSFLDLYFNNKEFIFIVFADENNLELAHNHFLNLKNTQNENNTLVVCKNLKTYEYFQNKEISSILLSLDAEYTDNEIDYYLTVIQKSIFICFLIKTYKSNLLITDPKSFYFKNPTEKINAYFENYDVLINNNKGYYIGDFIEGKDYKSSINPDLEFFIKNESTYNGTDFGLIFIKNNNRVKAFVDIISKKLDDIVKLKNKLNDKCYYEIKNLKISDIDVIDDLKKSKYVINDTGSFKIKHDRIKDYVKRMKREEWSWDNPIDVDFFSKRYTILDGNHRYASAKMIGNETIPCNIEYMFSDLDIETETSLTHIITEDDITQTELKYAYLDHNVFLNGYIFDYKILKRELLELYFNKAYMIYYTSNIVDFFGDDTENINRNEITITMMKQNNQWLL